MNTINDSFVIKYKKNEPYDPDLEQNPEVIEMKHLYTVDDLLEYIDKNRDEKIVVYQAKCIIDWS